MSKRTVISLMAACLLSALLCGCGGEVPAQTAPPTVMPTQMPASDPTEMPTETFTEAPTEAPTEPPTEAPTEPALKLELSETEVLLTEKGQTLELYCGEVELENISWFSDDESVAMFSQGVVVAINKGTTTVYATCQGQTVSCSVTCDVDPDAKMPAISANLLHAPRLAPPEVADMEDTSFFADAAFVGDSVSYVLQQWHNKTGAFGDATFLVRSSLGLQNSIDGRLKLFYRGREYAPEDAVAAAEVSKVFLLFGFNDVGLFGIDGTLERWEIFIDRILEKSPDIAIYIQSCTPIHHKGEYTGYDNELFDEYNAALKEFCQEKGYHYVDIAPYFKDFTNAMATKYSSDKFVHMTYDGTAVWERVLKAYAAEQTKGE